MSLNHIIYGNSKLIDVDFKSIRVNGQLISGGTSGLHTPNFGSLVGAVNLYATPSTYIRVGDIVNITGTFRCDPNAKVVSIDMDLLPGTTNTNANLTLVGSSNAAQTGGASWSAFDLTSSGGRFTLYYHTVNDASVTPANCLNTVFNFHIQYKSN